MKGINGNEHRLKNIYECETNKNLFITDSPLPHSSIIELLLEISNYSDESSLKFGMTSSKSNLKGEKGEYLIDLNSIIYFDSNVEPLKDKITINSNKRIFIKIIIDTLNWSFYLFNQDKYIGLIYGRPHLNPLISIKPEKSAPYFGIIQEKGNSKIKLKIQSRNIIFCR